MADSPYKLKFRPSNAERWLNCPGAPRICAEVPEQPQSKHAAEGTAAHELAAMCLKSGDDAAEWVGEAIEVGDRTFKITEEMARAVQVYLDAIRGDLEENGLPLSALAIEKDFQIEGIACLKGTNDASFSSPFGKLYVYDYKHGAGTYVEVKNNPQLLIYAIGVMQQEGWVNESIEIAVVQPRYRDEDMGPVRRWEISKADLVEFKATLLKGVQDACDPAAPLIPGPWCGKSFCPAFGVCPAVRKGVVAVTTTNDNALTFPDPAKLSPEQIGKVLEASDLISGWAKAVRDYAERQAVALGIKIPGYKLIQKKGRRAWVDEMAVETDLGVEFGDDIYEKKLKSPAQMEKIAGKERVKELTDTPDKGLELVPESAKGDDVTPKAVFEVIQ